MLFYVKAGTSDDLLSRGCESTRHWHYHADLDGVLGGGTAREREGEYRDGSDEVACQHSNPGWAMMHLRTCFAPKLQEL
jgi:hypothetical protein